MINSLVLSLFNTIFSIMRFFTGLITTPIYNKLEETFPDLTTYMTEVNGFISDYIIKGIGFAKEVFFNITYFPRDLMGILVVLLASGVALALGLSILMFIINVYRIYRNGDS